MSESIKNLKLGWITRLIALVLVILILAGLLIWKYETRETWPRLRQIDATLSILDEPNRLMNLASTFTGTNLATHTEDIDATVETRHEAVRALLDIQDRTFGIHPKSWSERGTGLDHICSWADRAATNVYLRLIATPSKHADIHATECDYWSIESLDFAKDGRLVSRLADNQPHDP